MKNLAFKHAHGSIRTPREGFEKKKERGLVVAPKVPELNSS